ncbi:hypothetical protein D3C87_2097920 [compost metagenome]
MMTDKQPTYGANNSITYTSLSNQTLLLSGDPTQEISKLIDGEVINFTSYTVA